MDSELNRCRPGFGASCSFCCGSHNYTVSPERIEAIFISRDNGPEPRKVQHPESSSGGKLIKDGMQCPNVGISQADPGIVGCLTYCDDHDGSGFESFFTGTCKHFHCPAWSVLTDRQVLFAAELLKDWYYYSLFINFPELVLNLCAEYEDPFNVPDEVLSELKEELVTRLMENDLF